MATYSITSISPQPGQPTSSMSSPNIQNAGQVPGSAGTLIRASTRPCAAVTRFLVTIRAEVICPLVSRNAVMARLPSPVRAALRVEPV